MLARRKGNCPDGNFRHASTAAMPGHPLTAAMTDVPAQGRIPCYAGQHGSEFAKWITLLYQYGKIGSDAFSAINYGLQPQIHLMEPDCYKPGSNYQHNYGWNGGKPCIGVKKQITA